DWSSDVFSSDLMQGRRCSNIFDYLRSNFNCTGSLHLIMLVCFNFISHCRSLLISNYAREMYSPPLEVLITNLSPALTKNGTLTTTPVSIVAGLEPPEAVSPLIPGSVS